MLRELRRQSLFNGVPGPSPWYPRLPDAPTPAGFRWEEVGDSGHMALVGSEGPVMLLGMYNWVQRISASTLLIWSQPQVEEGAPTKPVELFVVDTMDLPPLNRDITSLCTSTPYYSMSLSVAPEARMRLETTAVGQARHTRFPDPLCKLEELLILCHSSGIESPPERGRLALIVAHPSRSEYRLFPQDWYNEGAFDFAYQWVTRVVRDPRTGRVHGEGIRINSFILDDTLCSLSSG